jgi:hypothetical protein
MDIVFRGSRHGGVAVAGGGLYDDVPSEDVYAVHVLSSTPAGRTVVHHDCYMGGRTATEQ